MVQSLTKRQLTDRDIRSYVERGLGAGVASATELTDGWFNSAYAVTLVDGREVVLKVAPSPDVPVLTYEFELMRTEVEFYRRATAAGVPMPVLYHGDDEFMIVSRLRGTRLKEADLTEAERIDLRRQLGAVCRRLHTVTGPLFGYPRRDGRTRSASWRESFLAIIDDILSDAVHYDRPLPAPAAEIRALVESRAHFLDQVHSPVLVHYDLWDGNVFVARGEDGGWRIEGLIDGERAFYGDPIAEFVSLNVFGDPSDVPGFLVGYGRTGFSPDERERLRLYQLYLDLILVTEGATRGYDEGDGKELLRYAQQHLAHLLH